MSEPNAVVAIDANVEAIESPPASPQPLRNTTDDARMRLHRLASQLVRTQNRRLLVEFLTLRRATR